MENLDYQELILTYLQGEATEEEKRLLFKWVSESDDNRKELLQLKELWTLYTVASTPTLSRQQFEQELKSLRQRMEESARRSKVRLHPMVRELLKVACVAIVVAGATFLLTKNSSPNTTSEPQAHEMVLEQANQPKLYLADGTVVWLNARSKLTYPSAFTGTTREVRLEGEAYFDVAHNPSSPFIVHTASFDVVAKGTSFNVSSYADDDEFHTLLVKGNVEVKNRTTAKTLTLEPRDMMVFSKKTNDVELKKDIDIDLHTSWKEGLLRFNKLDFAAISKQLERKYNVSFKYYNEAIKQKTYSGTFLSYQSLDDILSIINQSTPFTYHIENNVVRIY